MSNSTNIIKPIEETRKITFQIIEEREEARRIEKLKKEEKFIREIDYAKESIMDKIILHANDADFNMSYNFASSIYFLNLSFADQERFFDIVIQSFKMHKYRVERSSNPEHSYLISIDWSVQ